MHHTYFVLSQKEPLAKLWLAALWDRKLSKSNIFETDIDSSIDALLKLEMKMALRTSGHLLLGIVKIYSRKANYLLSDCNEAFVKIRLAFRPGVLEATDKLSSSAPSAELSSLFVDARENSGDVQLVFTVNQSRPEDITLREDVTLALVDSEIFDDFGGPLNQDHLERWLLCSGSDRYSLSDVSVEKKSGFSADSAIDIASSTAYSPHTRHSPPPDTTHSPSHSIHYSLDTMQQSPSRTMHSSDLMLDSPPRTMDALPDTMHSTPSTMHFPHVQHTSSEAMNTDSYITGYPHIMHSPSSDILSQTLDSGIGGSLPCSLEKAVATGDVRNAQSCVLPSPAREGGSFVRNLSFDENTSHVASGERSVATEWSVDEPLADDTFCLNPVLQIKQGTDTVVRKLRKRKLIIDEKTAMEAGRMKEQLVDTSHTVATMEMAPPTKRFMLWLERGSAASLLSSLCRTQNSHHLSSFGAALRSAMECRKSKACSNSAHGSKTVQADNDLINNSEAASSDQHSDDVKIEPITPLAAEHLRWPVPLQLADTVCLEMPVDHSSAHQLTALPTCTETFSAQVLVSKTVTPSTPQVNPDSSALVQQHGSMSTVDPLATCSFNNTDNCNSLPVVHSGSGSGVGSQDKDLSERSVRASVELSSTDTQNDSDFVAELPSVDEDPEHEGEWSSRQRALIACLTRCSGVRSFAKLTSGNNRKEAAIKFHTLLMLKKLKAVDVTQTHTWADVNISLV